MKRIRKEYGIYLSYMISGMLCPVVLFIYYLGDLACMNMFVAEIVLGSVSILVAFAAMREKASGKTPIAHWLTFAVLLPWIAILPVKMLVNRGVESFLHTRLLAYSTMEAFAIVQVVIAVLMVARHSAKRAAMPPTESNP